MSETQPLLANGPPDFRRPLSKPRKRPVLARGDYPGSDGQPRGETRLHVLVLFELFGGLMLAHKGRAAKGLIAQRPAGGVTGSKAVR